MPAAPASVRVSNPELVTVREFMRDTPALLQRLDASEVEKLVVTQRNQMRAVIVSTERWAELERRFDALHQAAPAHGRAQGAS
jgi:PHD/YefM family antitoxin component YafN of YafNO toxin-antitoxin module